MRDVATIPSFLASVLTALALVLAAPLGAGAQESGKMYDAEALAAPGALEDRVLGTAEAPVTIVEYASMTCPHCAAFHKDVFPQLKTDYIDTGKARLIFREFPLDSLAAGASMVARCLPAERYFPFLSVLFGDQKAWVKEDPLVPLGNLAKQAGLSKEAFDNCLANQELLDQIVAVRDRGEKEFEIAGTPTFFVNGELVRAERAQTYEDFAAIIDKHSGQ